MAHPSGFDDSPSGGDERPEPTDEEAYRLARDELHRMRGELAAGRAPDDLVPPDEDGEGEEEDDHEAPPA